MSSENDQPVAYDTEGRPLYHRPQPTNLKTGPQAVHIVKSTSHDTPPISEEVRIRHEKSKQQFPEIHLSDGEYVISFVRRHPLGFISIWLTTFLACFFVVSLWWFLLAHPGSSERIIQPSGVSSITMLAFGLVIFTLTIGLIVSTIYRRNKFFLTNESVIQHIQVSLFSQNDQIVSLGNVEDASYRRIGILQSIFNYGSIRLSTQGDETTYRFHWVANPKKQTDQLNDAVENFKNGRPIEDQLI